jgi:hypothetical protein
MSTVKIALDATRLPPYGSEVTNNFHRKTHMNPNTAVDLRDKIEADRTEALTELNGKFDLLLQAIEQTYGITNLKAKTAAEAPKVPRRARAKKAEIADSADVPLSPSGHAEAARLNSEFTAIAAGRDPVTAEPEPAVESTLTDDTLTVKMLLKTGNEALPMSAIVDHFAKLNLAESQARAAVKYMLENGDIEQIGQKRGTKYVLTDTTSDTDTTNNTESK